MMVADATKDFLWVEKYRPKNIQECVLPVSIKNTFKQMVDSGESQNLLLSGGAGCGKQLLQELYVMNLEQITF